MKLLATIILAWLLVPIALVLVLFSIPFIILSLCLEKSAQKLLQQI